MVDFKKMAKGLRLTEMNRSAKHEACENNVPFTPYPLVPYCLEKIKERFTKDGTRTEIIYDRLFIAKL